MHADPMPLLTTQDLTVEVGHKTICRQLALQVRAGECWAVLGMNGAGKTTLLHTLAGLHPCLDGQVTLQGNDIGHLSRRRIATLLGLLLQDIQDAFPGTVLETVLIGRHPHLKTWEWENAQDMAMAQQALATVGLQGFEQRQVNTLSGGERRRLYLAVLLVQRPVVYLLDEPVNHLDLHHQHSILKILEQQRQQAKIAMIMVLHDINLAVRYCNKVLMMFEDGNIKMGNASELLNAQTLSELYAHRIREVTENGLKVFVAS